jgi:hypothetical protein
LLPIFDGGRLRAKRASYDAAYDQMVARYNGLLIAALNDVSDTLSALASVRKQIALEKRAVSEAPKPHAAMVLPRSPQSLGSGPQKNHTIAILQSDRGCRLAVIDCWILRASDMLEAGVTCGAHES